MEPFRSFTGDVRAGAWLASIHTFHETDTGRVKAALENIEDPAKMVLDEIVAGMEEKYLRLWFWTWDALQRAMLYVEREEKRHHNEKSFASRLMDIPENHPDLIRAISFTATAVSSGGVAPVALGATGLVASGAAKAATVLNTQTIGYVQEMLAYILRKIGIGRAVKGIIRVHEVTDNLGITGKHDGMHEVTNLLGLPTTNDGANKTTNMLGLLTTDDGVSKVSNMLGVSTTDDGVNKVTSALGFTTKDAVKEDAETRHATMKQDTETRHIDEHYSRYGRDEKLLNMLCAVASEEFRKYMVEH